MNIAIFGIGAVGGYCGALLARHAARQGNRVTFITRGGMLDAIRGNGLTLQTPEGQFTVHPHQATDDPGACGPQDLVLICTKTYHLDDAARQLAPVVGSNTTLLPLLNGVDNAERLRALLPQARVLNGCIYISAVVAEPGIIRHISGPGRVVFGAEQGDPERGLALEALFTTAGIPAEYRADIETAVWEKYLFIEPVGSAGSLTRQNFGGLLVDAAHSALLEGLLGELEAVALAKGVALPANIRQATLDKYRSFPAATKTSMQLDYEKGRQTEIESFSGYVIRAARALGVPAPLHEQVYKQLS
jgi:2-dehydropantoate 2-reductase